MEAMKTAFGLQKNHHNVAELFQTAARHSTKQMFLWTNECKVELFVNMQHYVWSEKGISNHHENIFPIEKYSKGSTPHDASVVNLLQNDFSERGLTTPVGALNSI